jgi:tetratricopeptide (TPR) repeat protein
MTRAKTLATELGDRVALAVAQRRLAEVRLMLGEVADAEKEARDALQIGESLGSRVHVGCAYRVLGEVAAARNDAPAADERFRKAVDILAAVKNEVELARAYRAFAAFRDRSGNTAEAHKLRTRADEIFGRLRGAAQTE